jgi:hypothetical protein
MPQGGRRFVRKSERPSTSLRKPISTAGWVGLEKLSQMKLERHAGWAVPAAPLACKTNGAAFLIYVPDGALGGTQGTGFACRAYAIRLSTSHDRS